jgi:DNA-damage-inducible protein J
MATNTALVQTRVDPAVKERASAVLEELGLTVSEAVRMLLTRIAHEGALPLELSVKPEVHDAWFRAKVREALDDTGPYLEHEEVEARFARKRDALAKKAGG